VGVSALSNCTTDTFVGLVVFIVLNDSHVFEVVQEDTGGHNARERATHDYCVCTLLIFRSSFVKILQIGDRREAAG
jgi:hypothetical protein